MPDNAETDAFQSAALYSSNEPTGRFGKTTNRKEIALFRKRSVLIDWAGFFTGQIPVSLSLSVVWNIFCFFWGYPDTRAHTQKKKTL